MWRRQAAWTLMIVWFAGWAYFGLPWAGFTLRPRSWRIRAMPFRRARRRDQFLNFVYYIPFGALGVYLGWPPALVALIGGLLSGVTELLQVFSITRVPSSTDLILNVAGTLVGIAAVVFLGEQIRRKAMTPRAASE